MSQKFRAAQGGNDSLAEDGFQKVGLGERRFHFGEQRVLKGTQGDIDFRAVARKPGKLDNRHTSIVAPHSASYRERRGCNISAKSAVDGQTCRFSQLDAETYILLLLLDLGNG